MGGVCVEGTLPIQVIQSFRRRLLKTAEENLAAQHHRVLFRPLEVRTIPHSNDLFTTHALSASFEISAQTPIGMIERERWIAGYHTVSRFPSRSPHSPSSSGSSASSTKRLSVAQVVAGQRLVVVELAVLALRRGPSPSGRRRRGCSYTSFRVRDVSMTAARVLTYASPLPSKVVGDDASSFDIAPNTCALSFQA